MTEPMPDVRLEAIRNNPWLKREVWCDGEVHDLIDMAQELLAEIDRCRGILARFGDFEQEWAVKTGGFGTVIWPLFTDEAAVRAHVEEVRARGGVAQVMCRLVGEMFPADDLESVDV